MSTTPKMAPAIPPTTSGIAENSIPGSPSARHFASSMKRAGTVKTTPVPAVLIPEAMVWLMLFSIIDFLPRTPLRRA